MTSSVSIDQVIADEVLDSRGYPAVRVTVVLSDGTKASASAPSGSSKGRHEASELRDHDRSRYGGRGVRKAIENVNGEIARVLRGRFADDQWGVDAVLNQLDGSFSKTVLGANATLGVSLACARVAAKTCRLPLFRYLGGDSAHVLPVPMLNVLNGGRHARGGADIEEFMLVPYGAPTFSEAMRYGAETYHALLDLLTEKGIRTGLGDEAGFVPELTSNAMALDLLTEAVERAGYRPGEDIVFALDVAAASFRRDGRYELQCDGRSLTSQEMVSYCEDLVKRYPIVFLEDPIADDEWDAFRSLTENLGAHIQIAGDDVFVSNRAFLVKGIAGKICNSVVLKPNQVGTVTETLDTARMALRVGYACVVANRSGETEDTSIADLAVALNCGQIKAGAPARERVAKYNRLLEIERMLGGAAEFAGKRAFEGRGGASAKVPT